MGCPDRRCRLVSLLLLVALSGTSRASEFRVRPFWGNAAYWGHWATKKDEYLRRWVDYLDDGALNARCLHELHPILNHDNGRCQDISTIRIFAGAALALPVNSDVVSPQAFARIMRKGGNSSASAVSARRDELSARR
jgi:hypothetical protein